jgi:hypothetical protein
MCRLLTGALAVLVCAPVLLALDAPAEEYRAILKEYIDAQNAYRTALKDAKTAEEKRKVAEEMFPRPDKFAERLLQLAAKHPKDPAAVDALVWVVNNAGTAILPVGAKPDAPPPAKPPRERALEILSRDYITSDKLVPLADRLGSGSDAAGVKLLHLLVEKNPNRDVQGTAIMSLALRLKTEALRGRRQNIDEKKCAQLEKDAEQLFERVVKEYGDVKKELRKTTLGKLAEPELFELRNLSIGKTVPDIEADDLDGKAFKLSEYRGKVVMLDFWGHW